ncbi:hypothetical protein SEUCBS139899_007766 [Sporothrix eucalyptigena]|uniref:Major facilitator superfamily (MFS) profile domain-containing protein n=1 Tax=Sporothrix eucalyptigena TaxID=1812306 RepID=A0ABP0B2R0_9PEZI
MTTVESVPAGLPTPVDISEKKNEPVMTDIEIQKAPAVPVEMSGGAGKMEAITAVFGTRGKLIIIGAMVISMIAFEFDNSTVYTYFVYAQSSYSKISDSAALTTAASLLFAVIKPLIAKLSDVYGRGEMYPFFILFYVISLVVCAKSPTYAGYSAGYILHTIAQTGINTMNDILTSDVSSARTRGLAVQIQFLPYLFMPYVTAYIIESVVNGIGWRWGIGMLAIIMPVGLLPITITVLGFQHKAKKIGFNERVKMSVYEFFSRIDFGGLFLFCVGLALILLPASLAGTLAHGWKTNWLIACLVIGIVMLIALPFYEKYVARHPFLPPYYFKDRTLAIMLILYGMDGIGLSVTHSYFYNWLLVAKGYSIQVSTWVNAVNGTMQFFTGLVLAATMYYFRGYKWPTVVGIAIRLLGYGLMFRIRSANAGIAELVIVQLIQGIGDGMLGTTCFVACTVNVPHKEVAQMTSLAVCLSMLGSSIGSAIGGGIYTSYFKGELQKYLGTNGTAELIESVYDSVTTDLPPIGSPIRTAIGKAYSQIMADFTYVAFGCVVPAAIAIWFVPNKMLTDAQNLVEVVEGVDPEEETRHE